MVEFYPSLSEELLNCSISFARSITTISESVIHIIAIINLSFSIKHLYGQRKEIILCLMLRWDLMMEPKFMSFVGLYLFNRFSAVINKSGVGVYRDDGLVAINNASDPKLDRIRKDIIALFKEKGLSIIIETNLNIFHFERLTIHHSTSTPFLTTHLRS